ncbi:hypothetical protein M9Y10_008787 [Tritrichomonas musculus]|uniref:Transposase Tc1-like domain-containing protein n=1 Tax=Tritrichomonas musculus TaxID=1915356 RepID=A0ABR2IZ20_9EUKA
MHNSPTLSASHNSPILSTMHNSPTLSALHNSPTLSASHNSPILSTAQNLQTLNIMHNSLAFNTLPNLIHYSPPFSFMHNSQPLRTQSFQNSPISITTLNASPLNTRTVHNLPTINLMQNPSNSRVSHNLLSFNQSQISHHINQENKSSQRIKSKIDESKVFKYYNKHGLNQTKVHFHIGFDRLQKILKINGKYRNKRKTNVEIDDFIVELASSGRQAFAISVEIEKRFHKHISRQTVIRRLKENHLNTGSFSKFQNYLNHKYY